MYDRVKLQTKVFLPLPNRVLIAFGRPNRQLVVYAFYAKKNTKGYMRQVTLSKRFLSSMSFKIAQLQCILSLR